MSLETLDNNLSSLEKALAHNHPSLTSYYTISASRQQSNYSWMWCTRFYRPFIDHVNYYSFTAFLLAGPAVEFFSAHVNVSSDMPPSFCPDCFSWTWHTRHVDSFFFFFFFLLHWAGKIFMSVLTSGWPQCSITSGFLESSQGDGKTLTNTLWRPGREWLQCLHLGFEWHCIC